MAALGVTLAHPLTEPFQLPLSPLAAASIAGGVVFLFTMVVPRTKAPDPVAGDQAVASWAGPLASPQVLTRALAVGLLVVVVVAGRLGTDNELENLAPALVVGVLWPLLVLASLVLGAVWRWVDPWDAAARTLDRGLADAEGEHVWPAVVPALAWVWYLSAYSETLSPRAIGAALALYTVITVAGALALGRASWFSTAEPFGILLSWLARIPRRRLAGWSPPRGAEVLLGVLAGGVLFGAVRRSELWGGLNTSDHAALYSTLGVVLFAAAAAGLFVLMGLALAPFGARPAAAGAALPALAGIVVAVAMDRNRLTTSVQLLPELLGDPFGRGWDLFGAADAALDPAPLGARGLIVAQLAVLLGGFALGAAILGRRLDRGDRPPAALLLAVLASAAVIALVSH